MTIIDTDIISATPPATLDDKKSLGIDLSESLFDYDLLLSDNPRATTTNDKDSNESLFETLFQDENAEAATTISSGNSSNSLSPPIQQDSKRPRIMQWGPQEGHESGTIVSVVLQHTEEAAPMKIVFGCITVETAQQQHRISSGGGSNNDGPAVWITLAASVPPLSGTRSKKTNQIQVSVCLFDQHNPDLAIDTWDIGHFTYLDPPEEIYNNYRKRALSCKSEQGAQKKTTFDIKQDDDDVDSQLLQLLAPYGPLLSMNSGGGSSSDSSSSNNLVSTPLSAAASVSWMSSPLDLQQHRHRQQQQNNNKYESSTPKTTQQAMLLQHGLIHQGNRSMYNTSYLANMPSKQEVYRNYLEMQERQRQTQQPPYLIQQQQQPLMSQQAVNSYINNPNHCNKRLFPFAFSASYNYHINNNNAITHNMAEQHRQNQQMQSLQQQKQQHHLVDQYNAAAATEVSRRASAPASSHSITNSNSCALNKAHLKLNGDLMDMMTNWSMPEWQSGRRLVHFWRHTNNGADGNLSLVECGFGPMDQQVYHQQRMRDNVAAVAAAAAAAVAVSNNSGSPTNNQPTTPSRPSPIVISCIYWRERNDYFITSVDCIYLLESLIGIQFTVEEKNRIRRNLEGFRPLTVSKCKAECADFFKLIMSFPHPKPRNIEKDVKVFAWKILPHALRKIIRKYTPSYIISTPLEPIQQHQHNRYSAAAAAAASNVDLNGASAAYGGQPQSSNSSTNMF